MIPNIQLYRMDDIGTRLQHLADLQELWSFALSIETAGGYQSETSLERSWRLEAALLLLEAHMMNDYSPTTYAQVINNLPRNAKDIPDGPMVEPYYIQCPVCKRENTPETWNNFGGKCPNCGERHKKE